MKTFDEEWRSWIARNAREGCSLDVLFKILHDAGFGYETIRRELGHEPALPLDRIFQPLARQADARWRRGPGAPFEALLEPGPSLEAPAWMVKATGEQQQRVPYLDAGGAACRGFEKRRLDPEIFEEVRRRFALARSTLRPEHSDAIGRYIDTVDPVLPPTLTSIDGEFNDVLLELLKPMHEEWCGFPLEPSTCYGFRVYLTGAYLHDHVDRQASHVISSTLCVDRHAWEPWPLHVIDADGVEHQVETEPGELILYESARICHGRPVPLNGRFHAALFLHYRPAEKWDLWIESPQAWLADRSR